jgi:hypothetical protein
VAEFGQFLPTLHGWEALKQLIWQRVAIKMEQF